MRTQFTRKVMLLAAAIFAVILIGGVSQRTTLGVRAEGAHQAQTAIDTLTPGTAVATGTPAATAATTGTPAATAATTGTPVATGTPISPPPPPGGATATAVATATTAPTVAPTAVPTATAAPLGAMPRLVASTSLRHQGKLAIVKWHMAYSLGIKGFKVEAGHMVLSRGLIHTHRSRNYKAQVRWIPQAHYGVLVLFKNGHSERVAIH